MKKILIVEDELAYVKLLREQLESTYKVICVYDGLRGLETAKREHPDLILLDVRMPGMDGMTMLKQLRKDAYGRTAKVILLTNYEANDKILTQVAEDLPTYYFVKSDIELFELLEKIQEVLAEAPKE